MLLNELTGIKAIKDKNPLEILQWIKDQIGAGRTGLRFLGKGSHGVALTDGTTVFKFWHKDSAYEQFVDFARYKDYDCLPKFKSGVRHLPFSFTTKSLDAFLDDYTRYREDIEDELDVDVDELDKESDEYLEWEDAPSKFVSTEGFSYIKMEKLDPVEGYIELFAEDNPFYGHSVDVFKLIDVLNSNQQYFNERNVKLDIFSLLQDEYDLNELAEKHGTTVDNLVHEFADGDKDGVDFVLGDDIEDLIYIIGELSYSVDESMKLDLHEGNFAMRDGKLVILDPFFTAADLNLARSVLKLSKLQI